MQKMSLIEVAVLNEIDIYEIEVFVAVKIHIVILCIVTPCSLVLVNIRFK
jgi:hypothetical protein